MTLHIPPRWRDRALMILNGALSIFQLWCIDFDLRHHMPEALMVSIPALGISTIAFYGIHAGAKLNERARRHLDDAGDLLREVERITGDREELYRRFLTTLRKSLPKRQQLRSWASCSVKVSSRSITCLKTVS